MAQLDGVDVKILDPPAKRRLPIHRRHRRGAFHLSQKRLLAAALSNSKKKVSSPNAWRLPRSGKSLVWASTVFVTVRRRRAHRKMARKHFRPQCAKMPEVVEFLPHDGRDRLFAEIAGGRHRGPMIASYKALIRFRQIDGCGVRLFRDGGTETHHGDFRFPHMVDR